MRFRATTRAHVARSCARSFRSFPPLASLLSLLRFAVERYRRGFRRGPIAFRQRNLRGKDAGGGATRAERECLLHTHLCTHIHNILYKQWQKYYESLYATLEFVYHERIKRGESPE